MNEICTNNSKYMLRVSRDVKEIFNKKGAKKYIPVILGRTGGIIGIAIYYTSPEIMEVSTIWEAIELGLLSGLGATGTNQIIKQLFKWEMKK